MKKLILLTCIFLALSIGCAPTPTPIPTPNLQATATQIAASSFATQTASVPTATPTPRPTSTHTPTATNTVTPTRTIAPTDTPKPVTPTPTPLPAMLVGDFYFPSGWMGDGEDPTAKYIQFNDAFTQGCYSLPSCIQVTYTPGPKGWAGIYWQFPENNWGDKPGRNLSGASRVVFWAKGQNGGERVEFKGGGINNAQKPFRDSFEKSLGYVTLTNTWQPYAIDLKGQNLENVIGAFAWIARKSDNPNGLVFYLDDISYEGIVRPK